MRCTGDCLVLPGPDYISPISELHRLPFCFFFVSGCWFGLPLMIMIIDTLCTLQWALKCNSKDDYDIGGSVLSACYSYLVKYWPELAIVGSVYFFRPCIPACVSPGLLLAFCDAAAWLPKIFVSLFLVTASKLMRCWRHGSHTRSQLYLPGYVFVVKSYNLSFDGVSSTVLWLKRSDPEWLLYFTASSASFILIRGCTWLTMALLVFLENFDCWIQISSSSGNDRMFLFY